MHFKMVIREPELQKLLRVFNKNFTGITYLITDKVDGTLMLDVNTNTNDEETNEELYEVLMDEFSSIQIQEVVKIENKKQIVMEMITDILNGYSDNPDEIKEVLEEIYAGLNLRKD